MGKVGHAKERRLERLVEDLRDEFDTIHRVCRLLLDDLERIEVRLTDAVSQSECDVVKQELIRGTTSVHELREILNQQELRIKQLEMTLHTVRADCLKACTSANTVINVTGAAVGKDVSGNVNVNE